MKTVFWMLVVVLAGCTSKNPNACDTDSDCKDSSAPFCDIKGEYPESHYTSNACSAVPASCPVERCGCTAGASLTCTDDQLTQCGGDGHSSITSTCPLGCAASEPRCATFDPSNELGAALTDAAAQPDVLFPPMARVDTELGLVQDSSGNAVSVKTTVVTLDGGLSTIRVLEAKSFVIDDVLVTGSYALAFVAPGSITFRGKVDASANASTPGSGAQTAPASCTGLDAVPQPQGCTQFCTGALGAGGGGNATSGGRGGFQGSPGGAVLTTFAPLQGGCRGGEYGGNLGGGGGGAVQVVSLTSILFTDHGLISVAGGGGASTAGGGSAGVVVLEAPSVRFEGANAGLVANGGAGGGCSMTGPDGTATGAAALGPRCSPNSAGDGGTAFAMPTHGEDCSGSCATLYEGGGGGAAGRARIATKTGEYETDAGPILSAMIAKDTLPVH